ncbi:MAG: hypothetical protein HOV68_04150, partial [Streptomycetaceae bacterium]|nr:hypothetical protein [Streptomycetaceae bacterium]
MSGTRTRRRVLSVAVPLCVAYAIGALLGWGSPAVSLTRGAFGLAAAAGSAAASGLVRAAGLRGRAGLSWALLGTSACMVAIG